MAGWWFSVTTAEWCLLALCISLVMSMEAVNSAYKTKALKYHPDKGGNKADFIKLHTCVALIKISKGH